MRKLLVALMMVAFAATAFAADVKFSGSYEFDGKYQKNYALKSSNVATNQYYEHDFVLWMNVQTDKDTFFKTKLELLDDTIGATTPTVGTDAGYAANSQISVQRAWMGHNFGAVTVEAGLMTSGTWGYTFGDNEEGSYRVKATFNDVAGGKLAILTQKKSEKGSDSVKDSEKDDGDKYSIGYKGTFGNLFIAPKLDYDINSDAAINQDFAGIDNKVIDLDVAAGYNMGALALQAEYQLKKTSYDSEDATHKDFDVYGWFINASYKMGAATVGALSAYGSVSSDMPSKGYDFNDDFDSTFILGDDLGVGGGQDLVGFWANAVYATYDATDKLSLMGKFAYATSNWDSDAGANAYLKDATAWEADASANYAITKELNYYFNVGYAKVDLDNATDPDAIILVKHGLVLSF